MADRFPCFGEDWALSDKAWGLGAPRLPVHPGSSSPQMSQEPRSLGGQGNEGEQEHSP